MSETPQTADEVRSEYREFLATFIPEVAAVGFLDESNRKDVAFQERLEAVGVSPHPIVDEAIEAYGGMEKFKADMNAAAAKRRGK